MTKCGHCGAKAVLRQQYLGGETDETCLMCGRSLVTASELRETRAYLERRASDDKAGKRGPMVASKRAINGTYWKEAS